MKSAAIAVIEEGRNPMHTKSVSLAVAGGLLGAAFALGGNQAQAQMAELKIGSHTPPKSSTLRLGVIPIIRQMEKDSGGTLKFKEFWGGQLTRSPRKQFEAMMNGLQDASPVLPSYTQKLFPDFSLFALPFVFRNADESSASAWKMHEKGLLRGLGRVKVVGIYTNDNSGMHFTKKITKLSAIKGKKIRAAGPGEAAVIKLMGGVPVSMSITQVAESLNRGVIQGTLNGWSALRSFRITPLVTTHVDLPFGVRSFFLGITKSKYDGLPAKARRAVDKNSGLKTSRFLGGVNRKVGDGIRAKAAKDDKRNLITPSAKQQKQIQARFQKLHDDWIANTPDGKKKYDTLQSILADIRKSS